MVIRESILQAAFEATPCGPLAVDLRYSCQLEFGLLLNSLLANLGARESIEPNPISGVPDVFGRYRECRL